MAEKSKSRQRRSRGRAWYWEQTDSWYFTPPGTKKRLRIVDTTGRPVRGKENSQLAELALARVKADGDWLPTPEQKSKVVIQVAMVCSRYLEHCEARFKHGNLSSDYHAEVARYLNELCAYCGALAVDELQKGHIQHWVESHPTWKSTATQRNAMSIVMAAFNFYTEEVGSIHNPLVGMQKPPQCPRLHSFSEEDEQLLYSATDDYFGNFLFAGIHTGLRPFCELARVTANDVIESERGMQWRVYASKTGKTRTIPVRSEVAELTRQMIEEVGADPTTTLFRNSRGGAWTKVAGVQRFRKIRQDLGWLNDSVRKQYSSYTCRHTFAHRMLAGYWNEGQGCSIEVLAELMGDTPKVAFDHYGREWGQHYQEPLWTAIGM